MNRDVYSDDQTIVDSLRFYFMLSTYLTAHDINEKVATQSMKEFIREEHSTWYKGDSSILNHFLDVAYKTLPTEFLSLMAISTKGDSDQVRFLEKKFTKY